MIIKFFSNISKSIFAKILFTAIILSFGLWGIGDIIKHYVSSRTVITVGKIKISSERYRVEFEKYKQNLRNSTAEISEEQLKKMDIKGMLNDYLIAQAVEEMTLRDFQILVPKRSVANIVYSLPEFQNGGKFDERIYIMLLQQSGMNEAMLLQQLRSSIARNQLYHPILVGYKVPDFIKKSLSAVYEANKTFYVMKLNINDVHLDKKNSNEDEKSIKSYFDNNSDKYRQPELRDIALLKIDYTKFVKDLKINEKEIDDYYKESKDSFLIAETRDIDRIEFNSKEEAEVAYSKINRGGHVNLQKEFKGHIKHFGEMKHTDLPKDIAEEVFEAKKNQTSNVHPIGGKFYLYCVSNINVPVQKTEKQIKEEVQAILQSNKINSPEFQTTIKEVKNKIDDDIATGKTVDDLAKIFNLEIIELKDFDVNTGTTNTSNSLKSVVEDESTSKEILSNINGLDVNQASTIIESKNSDTISYIIWTRKIKKSAIPPFEQIKSKVEKDYIFDKKHHLLLDNFNKLIESKDISKIKKDAKKFTFAKKDFMMKSDNKDSSEVIKMIPNYNLITDMLSTLKVNDIKYYRVSQNEYILVAVEKVDMNKEGSNTMSIVVNNMFQNTLVNDMTQIANKEFKNRQKIKINQKVIDELTKSFEE